MKQNGTINNAGKIFFPLSCLWLLTMLISNFTCWGGVLRTWEGGGVNALASNPTNWAGDVVPGPGDDIMLDTTTHKNMTWDLNISVQSWTQVGYTGTVTIATVYGVTGFRNLNIVGNCVMSNGVWTQSANPAVNYESNRLCVTIGGDLLVGTNAAIDVTGKGFTSTRGPGGWDGGCYGGCGATYRSTSSGPCYGSIVAPTDLGSGGDWTSAGGAILLTVGGMIRNDGNICAVGGAGSWSGSGGSIWLSSGTLLGSGVISANGGTKGGGGRIALVVTNVGADFSLYTGSISAAGGAGSGAGTVYLRTAAQGLNEGSLIVDNSNAGIIRYTEITSNVTGAVVGDVLIRNQGYLLLRTNQALTLSGIWSNGANYSSQWGSQVIFAGGISSTSTIYGASTFMGLTCTNASKTLLFQAGKTNTVSAQGRLTLKGSERNSLMLRSTTNDTVWKLNVSSSAAQDIEYVDVKDSDAMTGVGTAVTAVNSQNSGNNLNWRFITVVVGETNVWTGAGNTVWSSRTNWSLDRAPGEDDFILIPPSKPCYPVLDAAQTVNGIKIQPGASLALAGYNLTVKQMATVAGSLMASATETITFQSSVDFTGGAFIPARSTTVLAGNGDQSVNLGNLTFSKVMVLNSAGMVIFGNGFVATELRCEAMSGMRTLTFQQGTTVTLRDLVLVGEAGNTNITLRSSDFGQKWNLVVSGYRSVRGVDVQDSDASSGLPIPATFSLDSDRNPNWTFMAPSVWLGTSGTYFNTAANWSSGVVPDATTRVLVDAAANPMTITGAVTLLDLTVGGGAGVATGIVNSALNVLENITVLNNGTLMLNRPCIVSNGLFVLADGFLTHSVNVAMEVNKLDLTVYGNVSVDVNGVVDVTGKGYAPFKGPGGSGGATQSGGSYGGHGKGDVSGPCYGSIVAPTNLGSGGFELAGGGAILLRAFGEIKNDGLFCADGVGSETSRGTGAGGCISLTAGVLTGGGTIRANGGSPFIASPGGGGRIALVMTNTGADFTSFTGPVLAFGGGAGAGAGTIYKQSATDRSGRGLVWVDNSGLANGYTDVPPGTNSVAGEVDRALFYVTNMAMLRLLSDFTVGDLWMQSANVQVDLNFKTLLVHSKQHALSGSMINFGTIIWIPDVAGTVFSIR